MTASAPLELAFIVSLYTPYGGMQRTMLRIAQECVARGHHVNVLTGGWEGEPVDGIEVTELDTRAHSNHASNNRLAAEARKALQHRPVDCVTGFTKIPGLDVYYAGDPCYAARVDQTHGALYKLTPRYRTLKKQEEAVFSPQQDTEIILIAHQEKDRFIHYYQTQEERFHLLPPGINTGRLQQDKPGRDGIIALRTSLGLSDEHYLILAVGSRFKTKGIDRLVYAMASLPEPIRTHSHLVIVGEGDPRFYQRQARRLRINDHIHFTGARDDIASFYHAADMLMHAPYSENTGTVLIEAMVCGLPVLVTGNCGFAFHVNNADAGLVCEEPFEQSRLNQLLSDMLKRLPNQAWSDNGPAYCVRTDIEGLVKQAADVIIQRAQRGRNDNH